MSSYDPHVILKMSDDSDCRFLAAWLNRAAEAQESWSDALRDPEFAERVQLLTVITIPDLAIVAREILGTLEQRRLVVVADLYEDQWGLFATEFAMMVRLNFFTRINESYNLTVPQTVTIANVRQAAFDILSTAEDQGDGAEVLMPERLLLTLPRTDAEASRARIIAMRDFRSNTPSDVMWH